MVRKEGGGRGEIKKYKYIGGGMLGRSSSIYLCNTLEFK